MAFNLDLFVGAAGLALINTGHAFFRAFKLDEAACLGLLFRLIIGRLIGLPVSMGRHANGQGQGQEERNRPYGVQR